MSDDLSWKDVLSLAAAFLALCVGLATCQYVEHRIAIEKPITKQPTP